MQDTSERGFWRGQNVFVVMAGGGVVILPEHPWYGSICIIGGLLGFWYSHRREQMTARWSSVLWIAALLVTWGGIGYDYYDRHHGFIWDQEKLATTVVSWGPRGVPDGFTSIIINGQLLSKYKKTHKVAGVCFHDVGVMDHSDIQISKSSLYDITESQEKILIKYSDVFVDEMINRKYAGTAYTLLLVPVGINMDQFNTLRQAEALGVKLLGVGGGPP